MKGLVTTALILLTVCLYAQQDKIYLRNGSIIRGNLKSTGPSDTLHILVEDAVLIVPISLIAQIKPGRNTSLEYEPIIDLTYPKGWSTAIGGGLSFGKHNANNSLKVRPSISAVQIYRYAPWLNVGVSASINALRNYTVYPLSFDYYAVLGRSNKSIMIYASTGYSLAYPTSNLEVGEAVETKGGLCYQGGLGWQQLIGHNNIQYRIGYAAHEVHEVRDLNYSSITQTRRINRITIQIVFLFNY